MQKAWQVRFRLAARLHQRIQQQFSSSGAITPRCSTTERLAHHERQLDIASRRGWTSTSRILLGRIETDLGRLQEEARLCQRELQNRQQQTRVTVSELAADLAALEREFPHVEYDLRQNTLSVETNPITLEEVELGRFRIVLPVEELGNPCVYRVEAIDPWPAQSNSDIPHPHVSKGRLCEGEGRHAIRSALTAGHLLELFLIVRQILTTYNPGSAYVQLEDWSGTSCCDCGDIVLPDDRDPCENCQSDVCQHCSVCCSHCDRFFCRECLGDCEHCQQSCCLCCLERCQQCQNSTCSDCRDSTPHCPTCRKDDHDEQTPETTTEETAVAQALPAATATEIYADRVGQTGLVAGSRSD